jgi:hypothetical protein
MVLIIDKMAAAYAVDNPAPSVFCETFLKFGEIFPWTSVVNTPMPHSTQISFLSPVSPRQVDFFLLLLLLCQKAI